jgi:uncharacterized protein
LPFWFLNFEEIVEILIGSQPNRDADIEILRELIPMAKLRYAANPRRDRMGPATCWTTSIGIDTPVPYRASDLIGLLDEYIGKLDLKGELAPYKRLKARIETISRDPRYAFMFGSLTIQDTMAQALGRLFRIPVNGRPITILELGGLPSEIINVVVSVLARMAFDFGVWSGGRVPITFICEEAHRYVPIDRTLGFEPTKRAISRIAKEGRKYAIGLCVVSQRPAELDPSILSQCNTVFSLRLSNERDQEILKAGISDAAASLLEFMPTMGQGEAIAFGEGVSLPTRITFDRLPSDASAAHHDSDVLRKLGQGCAGQRLPGRCRGALAPAVALFLRRSCPAGARECRAGGTRPGPPPGTAALRPDPAVRTCVQCARARHAPLAWLHRRPRL